MLFIVDTFVGCGWMLVIGAARTGGIDGRERSLPYLLTFLLFNNTHLVGKGAYKGND